MEKREFRALIEEKLDILIKRVEREVPEIGGFAHVYEDIPENDERHIAQGYRMAVIKMPKIDQPDETKRYLEFSVYIKGCGYKATALVVGGQKSKVVEVLSKDGFIDEAIVVFDSLIDTAECAD